MHKESIATAAALLFLSATASPPEGLEFDPTPGSSLRKVWHEKLEWTLLAMSQSRDGQEIAGDPPGMSSSVERSAVVVDTYVELAPGRPRVLKRKVERARGNVTAKGDVGAANESFELELASALEGKTLVFRFDPDSSRYACTLERDEGFAETLERLHEDMDLRGLLPSEAAAEGSTWEIEPAALLDVLAQGGDFERRPDGQPECAYQLFQREDPLAAALISITEPEAEVLLCEGRARWVSTREEAETSFAVIELQLTASVNVDMSARLESLIDHVGLNSARKDQKLTMRWDFEGKGQLVWDLKAGHFRTFELDSEVDLLGTMNFSQDGVAIESEFELDGRHVLSAEAGD